nr:MAG TPA: hypothetical protein [Caudoviricetes sp.]
MCHEFRKTKPHNSVNSVWPTRGYRLTLPEIESRDISL